MWSCNNFPYFPWSAGYSSGGLFSLLLWGILLLVALLVAGKLLQLLRQKQGNQSRDRMDSLEILKTRYARGEITREEYSRLRDILREQ